MLELANGCGYSDTSKKTKLNIHQNKIYKSIKLRKPVSYDFKSCVPDILILISIYFLYFTNIKQVIIGHCYCSAVHAILSITISLTLANNNLMGKNSISTTLFSYSLFL